MDAAEVARQLVLVPERNAAEAVMQFAHHVAQQLARIRGRDGGAVGALVLRCTARRDEREPADLHAGEAVRELVLDGLVAADLVAELRAHLGVVGQQLQAIARRTRGACCKQQAHQGRERADVERRGDALERVHPREAQLRQGRHVQAGRGIDREPRGLARHDRDFAFAGRDEKVRGDGAVLDEGDGAIECGPIRHPAAVRIGRPRDDGLARLHACQQLRGRLALRLGEHRVREHRIRQRQRAGRTAEFLHQHDGRGKSHLVLRRRERSPALQRGLAPHVLQRGRVLRSGDGARCGPGVLQQAARRIAHEDEVLALHQGKGLAHVLVQFGLRFSAKARGPST